MISHEHKGIFIHIPKTGGTSVEKLLGCKNRREEIFGRDENLWLPLQHASASQLIEYNLVSQADFENYFKFAFVRNPFDLVVSEWKWRIKKQIFSPFSRYRWVNISLKQFIKYYISNKFENFQNNLGLVIKLHLTPQYNFIHDRDGNNLIDFVARFENFDEDLKYISKKLGLNITNIPHIYKTKRKHYSHYYDEETIELVKKIYAIDLEYFNYSFEK